MPFLTAHLPLHERPRLWTHLCYSGKARWGGFWSTSVNSWFGWQGRLGNSTRWVILPLCLQGLNIFLTQHFRSLLGGSWQVGQMRILLDLVILEDKACCQSMFNVMRLVKISPLLQSLWVGSLTWPSPNLGSLCHTWLVPKHSLMWV